MIITDNEIIKALECCNREEGSCQDCPLWKRDGSCIKELTKISLDLIKRKDEQINGLIEGQETLQKYLAEKNAEVEDLNKDVDRLSQCVMYHDGQMVDAVKEFAERLKALTPNLIIDNGFGVHCKIDNLVKEMTKSDFDNESFWKDTH